MAPHQDEKEDHGGEQHYAVDSHEPAAPQPLYDERGKETP